MLECLKYSPLSKALTMADNVLLVHLSKAYYSTNYSPHDGVIHFDVASHKTSIYKSRF